MITAMEMKKKLLSKKGILTKQQFRTLQGQIKSGDINGANKGLNKLIGVK